MEEKGGETDDRRTEFLSEFTTLFIEDTRQKIATLEVLIRELERLGKVGERYYEFTRIVHSIKGTASTFGFPTVSMIAHRLEDYMNNIPFLQRKQVEDVYVYIDSIARIVDEARNPNATDEGRILRGLPMAIAANTVGRKRITALVIGQKNVQFTIVEQELKSLGFGVVNSQISFQAIEMAVRMRPDLIMVNNLIDILSGIEVANIFRAMNATKDIPVVFITSSLGDDGKEKAKLQRKLPANVSIVRKSHFPDDIADALVTLGVV